MQQIQERLNFLRFLLKVGFSGSAEGGEGLQVCSHGRHLTGGGGGGDMDELSEHPIEYER